MRAHHPILGGDLAWARWCWRVALGLTGGAHLQSTRAMLHSLPLVSWAYYDGLPVVVLCLTFTVLYLLMPNTRVHWQAALVGGVVGGVLWHLNNYFSVLYVSRWVTNSRIYGSLAAIPVFMVGLYFSWLILLFGAQVAYAFQNRAAYLQDKQADTVNQRGREFIALRLMECIGQRFLNALPPAGVPEIADQPRRAHAPDRTRSLQNICSRRGWWWKSRARNRPMRPRGR